MSARTEEFTVEISRPLERLDVYLGGIYQAVSRGTIQRLIAEGQIRVNGQKVKASHRPHAGERIEVSWPEARPATAQPEDIPLDVIFEDRNLVVLNKPAGLVVHPASGNEEHTLVNALLHHCAGQLSGIGGVARPGIVHRLDKDTSGCLVVAKNDATHTALAAQFAGRSLEKVYHAILCGEVQAESGDIRAGIARHPTHRKRMAVAAGAGAREAWTSYKVLERMKAATLVEALLHTGRTHQIRVHFLHLGHPVVGDAIYGRGANKRFKELTSRAAPRQMLHARRISFTHPGTGKKMTFEAPWPADFRAMLDWLKSPPGFG